MTTDSTSARPAIDYIVSPDVRPEQVCDLYRSSGIRRPVDDVPRIAAMLKNANLVIGAFAGGKLVGLARALTDFSYCCYVSDLAVAKEHQNAGIGRELLGRVKEEVGSQSMLLLLASPEAMPYYPKVGMEEVKNGWIIKRAG
ncbi:MAG: GNAT family N-acetyltransferase [Ramlibacter sp.]|nr:GNAT family N-acetyltransferase [Ramlibacter sp.]